MNNNLKEIFTFDARFLYQIVLVNGAVIEGQVIDVFVDGIMMNGLQHIPTDKILYFIPLKMIQDYETPE
ncbi:membrane protein [Cronobacter phage vB_CsaM_GAP32]|uniref:Uncharacterized protein n=1 Tax=Cronobacter phage vB_CsaM_GAP32 TaxID=1141136 RepID=K4F675_9CAUD|nr:membrane protein [Cronobacter phage vB_CsaM_GAP32]AFC21751.1 hypothetical protein GAP32_301 [Cronobacter phage vB_CsaM_GAP32]